MIMRGSAVLLAALVVACSAPPVAPTESPPTAAPPTIAASPSASLADPSPTVSPSTASSEAPPPDAAGPPAARLAAEGGDLVTGQLGTYVWRDQGAESPWLPGTPIAVGLGEPMTVTLAPAATVASWRARIVPADSTGPDGSTPVGKGSGTPRFDAPKRGGWTLEVHIVFADGIGDASYFWRLEIR